MKKKAQKGKKKSVKKKNKYTRQKYPALNVAYQVSNRRELIDYDYLDKLSPKEKEWLDRFTSEYVITNFNHRGDQIFTDEEDKRELYRENNRRNSDVFSVSKANGKLQYGYRTTKSRGHDETGTKRERDSLGPDERINDEEDYLLTLLTLKRYASEEDE